MSREAVGKLIDKWLNDSVFREELRKNPEGTARKTGIPLSEEEWSALRKVDWKKSDEELKASISKGM